MGPRGLARWRPEAARFIAERSVSRSTTKVGQAGGWDPATGAAIGRGSRHAHEAGTLRTTCYRPPTMDGVVLVLNQNYEPLNVCNLPRAFRLVFGEKAEVIEYDHQVIRTPRTEYRAPSVIRLQYLIRRPRPRVKLSPARGLRARPPHLPVLRPPAHDLTLDHVMPRHRGGGAHLGEPRHRVQAVQPPQGRQDARGGAAASAREPPFEPRSDMYSLFTPYLADDRNEAWRTYLFLGRN